MQAGLSRLWRIDVFIVEPLNKGHYGDNTNSAVMSIVERLTSFRGWLMYENNREDLILGPRAVSLVERSIIQCPFSEGPLLEVLLYTVHPRLSGPLSLQRFLLFSP